MGTLARIAVCVFFFFFNDTATTEIYTLSLHDALPIYGGPHPAPAALAFLPGIERYQQLHALDGRSEEHTSELQSRPHLVCRLLLEKKKTDVSCCRAPSRNAI